MTLGNGLGSVQSQACSQVSNMRTMKTLSSMTRLRTALYDSSSTLVSRNTGMRPATQKMPVRAMALQRRAKEPKETTGAAVSSDASAAAKVCSTA